MNVQHDGGLRVSTYPSSTNQNHPRGRPDSVWWVRYWGCCWLLDTGPGGLDRIRRGDGSYQIDPNTDATNSTGDPDNATKALDEALRFDYNTTPITDFLNNDFLLRDT